MTVLSLDELVQNIGATTSFALWREELMGMVDEKNVIVCEWFV